MSDRSQPRTPRTSRPSRPVESPFDAAALQAELGQAATVQAKAPAPLDLSALEAKLGQSAVVHVVDADAALVFLAATEPVVKTDSDSVVDATPAASKPPVKGRRSSSPRPEPAIVAEAKKLVDDVIRQLEAVRGLSGMAGWEGRLLRKKLPLRAGASFTVVNDHLRALEAGLKRLKVCEDARDSRKQAAAKASVKASAKASAKAAEAAKLSKDASALVERAAALTESQQRRVPQWVFLALRKPLAANAPANVVDSFVKGIALLEEACAAADDAVRRTAEVRANLAALSGAAHPGKTESDHRPGGPWDRAQRRAAEKQAENRAAAAAGKTPGKK